MDLVTLIAACALSIEPKLMHALIWQQSGGDPWSFSVPGESLPRVLQTIQDAILEARTRRRHGGRIRAGLTGLSTHPRAPWPACHLCRALTSRWRHDGSCNLSSPAPMLVWERRSQRTTIESAAGQVRYSPQS